MEQQSQRETEQRAISEEQARLGRLLAEMVLDRGFKLVTNDLLRLARKLLRRTF